MIITLGRLGSDKHDLVGQDQLLILLSYLAIEGPTSRERLARVFWPSNRRAANNLSSALTRLRQAAPGCIYSDREAVAFASVLDASEVLADFEAHRHDRVAARFHGTFLRGYHLPRIGTELEQWIFSTREHLGNIAIRSAIALHANERSKESGQLLANAAFDSANLFALEATEIRQIYNLFSDSASQHRHTVRAIAQDLSIGLDTGTTLRTFASPTTSDSISIDDDMARLDERVIPGCKVAIVGPSGSGKRSLLRRFAETGELSRRFSGGIVPLETNLLTSGTVLRERVLAALGTPRLQDADGSQLLALEWARPVLFVFYDVNPTSSICSAVASLVRAPLSAIITTSAPFPDPDFDRIMVEGLPTYPTVESERSNAMTYLLKRLDEADATTPVPPGGVELVARTGGIPLTVELLAELVTRRGWNGVVTAFSADDAPISTEAVLNELWIELRRPEKDAIAKLAQFAGSFSHKDVEKTTDVTLAMLAKLQQASLLERDNSTLRFPAPVKKFVQQTGVVNQPRALEFRRRLFAYLIETGGEIGSSPYEVRCQPPTLRDDYEELWDTLVDERDWDAIEQMAFAYYQYLAAAHDFNAVARVFAETLAVAGSLEPPPALPTLRVALGWAYLALGRTIDAASLYNRDLFDSSANASDLAIETARVQARLYSLTHDYASAIDVLSRLVETIDDDVDINADSDTVVTAKRSKFACRKTQLYIDLGRNLRLSGAVEQSSRVLRIALDAARDDDNVALEARVYLELSKSALSTNLDLAMVLCAEGLRLTDDPSLAALHVAFLQQSAEVQRRAGEISECLRLVDEVLEAACAIRTYDLAAESLLCRGLAEREAGSVRATRSLHRGLTLAALFCEQATIDGAIREIAANLTGSRNHEIGRTATG